MLLDIWWININSGRVWFYYKSCHWYIHFYLWCRWEKLLPMVSFFLPFVLLPLVQFSNQKQEFLPLVRGCRTFFYDWVKFKVCDLWLKTFPVICDKQKCSAWLLGWWWGRCPPHFISITCLPVSFLNTISSFPLQLLCIAFQYTALLFH